jgi:EmrB/QacA subfamily drug resistance transporter
LILTFSPTYSVSEMPNAHRLLAERPPLPDLARLPYYRWLVVGTVCIGAFLGQLDASIASLVLPTLEDVFAAPVAAIEWVALAYLLTLAALVVPIGRLADLLGRKALYVAGFVVFILGSALCGLAPTLGWLILFRVLQAVGAALLQANSVAIIAAAARPNELGRAIGVQGAAQAVGLAVGPSIGGMLIAALGWQWVFFIAVPFGIAGAALGWLVLPLTVHLPRAEAEAERFDWPGAALLGPAIALGLLALTYGNVWGWTSPRLAAVLLATAALLALFVGVERRARFPLVDFALFRNRVFVGSIAAGLLSYAVLFGSLFLLPFELQRVLGHGPAEAGLLLSPIPAALGLVAPWGGILADRIGSRALTVVGMLVAAVALLSLALTPGASLPVMLGLLALLGAGIGLFTPANNSAIMASAPPYRRGVAAGLLNMTRSLGTSLGVAAVGTLVGLWLAARLGHPVASTVDAPPAALEFAFQAVLFALAALAVLTALLAAARGEPGTVSLAPPALARLPDAGRSVPLPPYSPDHATARNPDAFPPRGGGDRPTAAGHLSAGEATATGSITGLLVGEATLLAPAARSLAGPTHVGAALAVVALGGLIGAVVGRLVGLLRARWAGRREA